MPIRVRSPIREARSELVLSFVKQEESCLMHNDERFDIRPAREDEMDQLGLMAAYSYAGAFGHGPRNVVSEAVRAEWTL